MKFIDPFQDYFEDDPIEVVSLEEMRDLYDDHDEYPFGTFGHWEESLD